jgi:hypothetical protein
MGLGEGTCSMPNRRSTAMDFSLGASARAGVRTRFLFRVSLRCLQNRKIQSAAHHRRDARPSSQFRECDTFEMSPHQLSAN